MYDQTSQSSQKFLNNICSQDNSNEIYKIQEISIRKINPVHVSEDVWAKSKKILTIGETGSGKTTIINSLSNIYLGVEFNDHIRYKIILENQHSDQTQSQTSVINSYFINDPKKRKFPLIFIDTPGLGDTKGIQKDNQNLEKLIEFLKKIPVLDCIVFVIKSSCNRLTDYQKYISTSLLQQFGNDVRKTFCLFCTFHDSNKKRPQAIKAAQDSNIPIENVYVFNSSGVLPDVGEQDQDIDYFQDFESQLYWNLFKQESEKFIEELRTQKNLKQISLKQSQQVINLRNTLEKRIMLLLNEIKLACCKINSIENIHQQKLSINDITLDDDDNNRFITKNKKEYKEKLSTESNSIYCNECEQTCHKNCEEVNNQQLEFSKIIKNNGKCNQCKNSCHWSCHSIEKFIIKIQVKEDEEINLENLLKLLLVQQRINDLDGYLNEQEVEIITLKKLLFEKISVCYYLTQKINEISLISSTFNVIPYYKRVLQTLFDKKNYQVGEEIELVEEKLKFLQVLEFLSENQNNLELEVMFKILNLYDSNLGSYCDQDLKMYQEFIDNEKTKIDFASYLNFNKPTCPRQHFLSTYYYENKKEGKELVCDSCNKLIEPNTQIYQCKQYCDFDICQPCVKLGNFQSISRLCLKGHYLSHIYYNSQKIKFIICDECDLFPIDQMIGCYNCSICNYDRCELCQEIQENE